MPQKLKTDRIGETHMQNCGLEATIIAYENANKITVIFSDGTVIKNKAYVNFKRGRISHPCVKNIRYQAFDKRVGETRMQNCGVPATIIEYKTVGNITVKFPDGTIVENRTYGNFKKGEIMHPDLKYQKNNERIGETRMQNCGLEATIIDYKNINDITVRFPDGTELKNRSYSNFKKGEVSHPDEKYHRYQIYKERIGETRMQNCGAEATIIGYRKTDDITVRFTDGTIVTNRSYDSFLKGHIQHPNSNGLRKTERIGETRIQNCGIPATIVEYSNGNNITIRFHDGVEIKNKNYGYFIKGKIGHPTMYTYPSRDIGKIHPKWISKLYNTDIYGVAYIDGNGNYYYYTHCPICGEHNIMTFEEIRGHACNRKIVCERDAMIQEHVSKINTTAA